MNRVVVQRFVDTLPTGDMPPEMARDVFAKLLRVPVDLIPADHQGIVAFATQGGSQRVDMVVELLEEQARAVATSTGDTELSPGAQKLYARLQERGRVA